MPRLYFIRHGETDWNRLGKLQGGTETRLNARGRRQAEAVAPHLASAVGADSAGAALANLPFVASPMIRARETVEILRGALGLVPHAYTTDARLREIGFGSWEGRTWPEIRARDPIGARDRDRDRWAYQPPGGESYAMVAERVGAWLTGIKDDCCVVAHGGIARVVMVLVAGADPAEVVRVEIWQGKVLLFNDGRAEWLPDPGHA